MVSEHSESEIARTFEEYDERTEDGDDGIDDPELLELAEASVRALPLKELAAIAGTYKYTPGPDFTKIRAQPAVDEDAEGDQDSNAAGDAVVDQEDAYGDEEAADENPLGEEAPEPETVGGACPACGRQAQKGWKTCPWCGSGLPA